MLPVYLGTPRPSCWGQVLLHGAEHLQFFTKHSISGKGLTEGQEGEQFASVRDLIVGQSGFYLVKTVACCPVKNATPSGSVLADR